MRIDVAEYITECRRISQYCQDRQTEITELKSALATFRSEMEEHFVGKTGTAIVSYLDEAIKPALEKTETLLADEIETMNTMINDMLEYFEEDGIVDLDYINDEYLYHFNRFSDAVSENLDETNRITRSINHIIELPRLNVDFPQELKHAMRRTVDNVTNLVTDLDRHWQSMLDRIDEQTTDIKKLLEIIDNVDTVNYSSGTIGLQALKMGKDYFDVISKIYGEKGKYGGNQHFFVKRVWEDLEYAQFIENLLNKFPHYNAKDMEALLQKLEHEGCGYVALTNLIFEHYFDNTEEFEKIFGFPFYDKNGDINFDYLIADFYFSTDNHTWEGMLWWREFKYDENAADGVTSITMEERFEWYLKSKGLSGNVKGFNLFNGGYYPATEDNFYKYKGRGYDIILSMYPTRLYNVETGELKDGEDGHAVVLLGIDENGNYIVSSWGEQYVLKLDDYPNLEGLSYVLVEIK